MEYRRGTDEWRAEIEQNKIIRKIISFFITHKIFFILIGCVIVLILVFVKFYPDIKQYLSQPTAVSPRTHDSFAIEEAENFFRAVKSASSGTYSEKKFPPGFDRSLDIKYEGALILSDDKSINGEMKFSHKKSANIFTLKADGSVYPSDGNEWTEPVSGMKFVWISGGCDEKECVEGFWMGKNEVTQGQWKKIMGENNNPSLIKKDELPANVNWEEATEFIAKLNESDKESSKKYRLPREREWEYACRNSIKLGTEEWCEDDFGTHKGFKSVRKVSSDSDKSFQCSDRSGMKSDQKIKDTSFRLVTNQTK